jgi:hypothetical protein
MSTRTGTLRTTYSALEHRLYSLPAPSLLNHDEQAPAALDQTPTNETPRASSEDEVPPFLNAHIILEKHV